MKVQELEISNGEIDKIFKALASETRWKILKLVSSNEEIDVSGIAKALNQTEANISAQIKILEKVSLLTSRYKPGKHGVRKICKLTYDKLVIKLL